ncbi:hypothetical protein ABZ929_28935, partial [Streptomyces physcomitrii]
DVDAWLRGILDEEFLRWNTPLKPVTDRLGARAPRFRKEFAPRIQKRSKKEGLGAERSRLVELLFKQRKD